MERIRYVSGGGFSVLLALNLAEARRPRLGSNPRSPMVASSAGLFGMKLSLVFVQEPPLVVLRACSQALGCCRCAFSAFQTVEISR
ncbi:MAG: hypothetical protein CL917_12725 [Deltaproteobacteria bacterium]|nr:hypothetical protein [Deltaproteobacteria bacterium]